MPSSSARCSQLPRAVDKVPFYEALRKFKDHLNGKLPNLDTSEITFPDVFLKTAVKKEVKEEKMEESEKYPGEMDPSLPEDQQLLQFVPGSYQIIPHSSQSSMSSQGSFNQSSPDFQSSGIGQLMPAVSSPSTVHVKQEPIDLDCQASGSCSRETISIGQFEVYNQPQNSSQNDSHLNNYLNGLYGLVGQVAGDDRNSKYGMVSNTGMFTKGPVQFNDALRDIVRENSSEELNSCANMDAVVEKPPIIQESQGKSTKSGRPRKRKSKTAEGTQSMPLASVSSPNQHYNQPVTSPNNEPNMLHSMQPYTSHMTQQDIVMPGYSNAYISQMQGSFPPPMMNFNCPLSQQSFTQMMNSGASAMGMVHNNGMPNGYLSQHISHNFPDHYSNDGGQLNRYDQNMPIKQEKTDN